MQPEPPLPVAARFYTTAERLEVDFDHVLDPGPLDALNWAAVIASWKWFGQAPQPGTAAGNTVSVPLTKLAPDVPPNECSYAPPPFDVVSRRFLVPAAAFDDFPLTVLP